MKIRKLKENYLDDLHNYNKKRQKGMSPFCYLKPNAGDVPKTIDAFNNSIDSTATLGISEDYEEEIIKDDPEVVEELKSNLNEFGTELKNNIYIYNNGGLGRFRLNNIDFEVDYKEEQNDYYLVLYFEVKDAFTGKDFRSEFVPLIIDIVKDSIKLYKPDFEFHIEINCFDINNNSYAACTLFVNNIGSVNNLSFTVLTEASYGGAYDIEDNQYFTREEINDFANDVCYVLDDYFGYTYDIMDTYMKTPTQLYIEIYDNNGFSEDYLLEIDMRKIRTPRDLWNKYLKKVSEAFKMKFERDYQDANLDESLKEWLAPSGLSDDEYMKLIKERRPGYSFDRINNGKNRSQVLFRTLDRIIKQDEERKARKLEKEKFSELTHKPVINDPKYNFEDDEISDFYKVESCGGNKMRFKKLNESYVDGDSVYLEYPSLHVEFDYVPDKYAGKHGLEEPDYVLYGETYEDDIEYEYEVDRNSIIEEVWDFIADFDKYENIPNRNYLESILYGESEADNKRDRDYYSTLIENYINGNFEELVKIFNDKLLDHFEEDAAEKAANEIRKDL